MKLKSQGRALAQRGALIGLLVCGLSWASQAQAGGDASPESVQAAAFAQEAEALEKSQQWRPASWRWTKAWETDPTESGYGLSAGLASLEAGDCPKAKRLLDRYLASDDDDRRDTKRAQEALAQIETAGCATPDPESATEDAKDLYVFAEEQAAAQQWEDAMYAYEDAYFLVPEKVGFAFKVGKAAFEARRCDKAQEYLNHFDRYGDPEKHAGMLAESEGMQNRLETLGCGQDEAPPPSKSKGCAIDSRASGAPMTLLGLLLLSGSVGRRRRPLPSAR